MPTPSATAAPRSTRPACAAALAAALALGASLSTRAAPVVFSDGGMSLAGFASTPTFASAGVSLNTTTVASPGNPAPALAVTASGLGGQTGYAFTAGFLYSAFSYDPGAQGAIASIDLSIDRAAEILVNGNTAPGLTLTARALIEQGGNLYMSVSAPVVPLALPALTTLVDNGLLAGSFGLFDVGTGAVNFALNPDFAAGPMQFGFAMRLFITGIGPNDGVDMAAWADNLRLQLNPMQRVPAAGTLLLAVLGLALLALGRRRAP